MYFEGFIKDVRYKTFLAESLRTYPFGAFEVNSAKPFGKLLFPDGEFAYSKWVSPKRTRSYPFERLYNTFNSPFRFTVIPIIKDEGLDGDLDRIQYSTISWMNLLNIYVVLAYYDQAEKNVRPLQALRNKITKQKLNSGFVNLQISSLREYKQSALHWNRTLIEKFFVETYQKSLESYQDISKNTGVAVHGIEKQQEYLAKIISDFEQFKNISLHGSQKASLREIQTSHRYEYLAVGKKATFQIKNYLGGIYYLTADEVLLENNCYIIQESKNATAGFLPGLPDIKDGLFKLILFSNLDNLLLESKSVNFSSRLKLTGKNIAGSLKMPCSEVEISDFLAKNVGNYRTKEHSTINQLNLEAQNNVKLEIIISGNHL
jgi:hypothetical protein